MNLSLCTDQDGPVTLWLTDVLGRELRQQQVGLHAGPTTTLPLTGAAELAAGVYLLHVQQVYARSKRSSSCASKEAGPGSRVGLVTTVPRLLTYKQPRGRWLLSLNV